MRLTALVVCRGIALFNTVRVPINLVRPVPLHPSTKPTYRPPQQKSS
jgi:hypothetical protein